MSIKTDQPLLQNRMKVNQIVANFWNKTSEGWRLVWGPHIHHGYYENNEPLSPQQAQEVLIDKLTELLDIHAQDKILDVGCGMGGSSIYLATKYHADVVGITLSNKQVSMATEIAKAASINNVKFQIGDALSLENFQDKSFDIIWSLESCEQFFDKKIFLQQAHRKLKPGGKLMLATWCSDQDVYSGEQAKQYKKLCLAFDLPYMPTINYYHRQIESCGFTIQHEFDWTKFVEKSWEVGISQLSMYSLFQILKIGGWRGFRFVKQLKLMRDGFAQKRINYGVFLAVK